MNKPFWEAKSLAEMDAREWESLCDGCARCCLIKLQDSDTDEVAYTRIVCKLLDSTACRCTRYAQRHELVADCVVLTPTRAADFSWLPVSCAYRTLAEQRPLASWHPLLSGRSESVHEAGISVRGRVVSEEHVHPDGLDEHIVRWVEV